MRRSLVALFIALLFFPPLGLAGPQSAAPHGPLFTSASATARAYGWAVAGIGDVDGDGYGDIAISDYLDGHGAVFVYLGSAQGIRANPAYTLRGEASVGDPSQFGYSLAAVGDVDGDDRGDFVAGAPLMYGEHTGKTRAGRVYLFTAASLQPETSASSAPLILFGKDQDDRLGMLLSGGGHDATGDGVSDFLASAPLRFAARGAVYLVSGGIQGKGTITALASGSVIGEEAADELGEHAITFIPDVTGDGRAEWAVGAPEHSQSDMGRVYLLTGLPQAANVSHVATRIWHGEALEEGFGLALATTRSATGETLVAAASFRQDLTGSELGRISLLSPLAPSGPVSTRARTLLTGFDGGTFGARIASGDFDGDGFPDLIVGAPVAQAGTASPGQVTYIPGPLPDGVTLDSTEVSARILGDLNGGRFGFSVSLVTHPDAIHPAGILVGQPRGESSRAHLLLNQRPVADFFPARVPCTGLATNVTLDSAPSTDPDGPADLYQMHWTRMADGSAHALGIGRTISLALPVGVHDIQLVAVDNFLAKSITKQGTAQVYDPEPPKVSIRRPLNAVVYIEDETVADLRHVSDEAGVPLPVIHVGKTRIHADASDRCSPIARVDFYLDDRLVSSDMEAPYEFEYDPHAIWPAVKHVFALAYDTEGNEPGVDCVHATNTGWAAPHHLPIAGEGPPPDAGDSLVPSPLEHVISGHPKCREDSVDTITNDLVHPVEFPMPPIP